MEYVAAVPAPGVPLSVPVPFPLFLNATPVGSGPVSLRFGIGIHFVITVNVPAAPTVNVVLLALVIAEAWFTVSVKFCDASVPTPLCTLNVMEYVAPVPAPVSRSAPRSHSRCL